MMVQYHIPKTSPFNLCKSIVSLLKAHLHLCERLSKLMWEMCHICWICGGHAGPLYILYIFIVVGLYHLVFKSENLISASDMLPFLLATKQSDHTIQILTGEIWMENGGKFYLLWHIFPTSHINLVHMHILPNQ